MKNVVQDKKRSTMKSFSGIKKNRACWLCRSYMLSKSKERDTNVIRRFQTKLTFFPLVETKKRGVFFQNKSVVHDRRFYTA